MISNIFPIVFIKVCTQTLSKYEALVFVEKNDLAEKNPRKLKSIFRISNFHITHKKMLDTLGVPMARTRQF